MESIASYEIFLAFSAVTLLVVCAYNAGEEAGYEASHRTDLHRLYKLHEAQKAKIGVSERSEFQKQIELQKAVGKIEYYKGLYPPPAQIYRKPKKPKRKKPTRAKRK